MRPRVLEADLHALRGAARAEQIASAALALCVGAAAGLLGAEVVEPVAVGSAVAGAGGCLVAVLLGRRSRDAILARIRRRALIRLVPRPRLPIEAA